MRANGALQSPMHRTNPNADPLGSPGVCGHTDTLAQGGEGSRCAAGGRGPGEVLPSYRALKPWALTAKSVVNHSVRMDPELTTDEGSWNPESLGFRETEEHS